MIKGGQSIHALCRSSETINGSRYKDDSTSVYIFKESIVYPFVQVDAAKQNMEAYFTSNVKLCTVVEYVQTTRMCHLQLLLYIFKDSAELFYMILRDHCQIWILIFCKLE